MFINLVQMILLLMALCAGIILGAMAVTLIHRSRDDKIWAAINARNGTQPAVPPIFTQPRERVHAVVTTAPRPVPSSVLGDETVINPRYVPTDLDGLRASMEEQGYPGTDPDHKFRVSDTMPGRPVRQGPQWDIPHSFQSRHTDTVSGVDTEFMWPSGETTSQLLDRLERDAYDSSRAAICG